MFNAAHEAQAIEIYMLSWTQRLFTLDLKDADDLELDSRPVRIDHTRQNRRLVERVASPPALGAKQDNSECVPETYPARGAQMRIESDR